MRGLLQKPWSSGLPAEAKARLLPIGAVVVRLGSQTVFPAALKDSNCPQP